MLALLVLALLVGIFALRNREDIRGRKLRWRLMQLVILVWLVVELATAC